MMKSIFPYLLLTALLFSSSFSGPVTKNIFIIFMGDSITEGTALSNPEKDAPGVYTTQILRLKKGINGIEQSNQGFSGHTTIDFLPASNTDFPKTLTAAHAISRAPETLLLFSIMLGTNDSAISGPNGSPVSPAEYKKNLQLIISGLLQKFPAARVVLQYPIWYSPNTHNGARYLQEGLSRLQSYYPQLDDLVKEFAASYPHHVYAGSKSGFDKFRKRKEELFIAENGNSGTFYLHPNEKGSEELAKIWVKGIENAIKD
ncbi:GDSL-type esterase/lipase family protein [Flavihumibacter fluvii]|uniref:GDSL-type esterase/lipase family protein n=1 Tax=Flavihumibacter fluvii TaxID=2838157 RepID=UPI001BDE7BA8|nr:GDSL-type esterase/lipase family protein [Flavihumibacter fluvii]ULQ54658.1 GDSL-type esterase/lipase family protein [Flavihumibacter fluvii]